MEQNSQISKSISVLYRHTQAYMARQLEPFGIGMGQYAYIIAVCRQPGITQDGLTGQLLYNKSSVARAIAQLEKNGFMYRETDPRDKRSYRLYPTPKGLDVLEVIMECLKRNTNALTGGFTPREQEMAQVLLARMAARAVNGAAGKDGD